MAGLWLCVEPALIGSHKPTVPIFPGSMLNLALAKAGIFILQKLADTTNQGFPPERHCLLGRTILPSQSHRSRLLEGKADFKGSRDHLGPARATSL